MKLNQPISHPFLHMDMLTDLFRTVSPASEDVCQGRFGAKILRTLSDAQVPLLSFACSVSLLCWGVSHADLARSLLYSDGR